MNIKNTILCASALAFCASLGVVPAFAGEKQYPASFKHIEESRPDAFTVDPAKLTPEEKAAMAEYDKKFNAAVTLMNAKDYPAAEAAFKPLLSDKSVKAYYHAKTVFRLADIAFKQKREVEGRKLCSDLLSQKDILSRDRANAAQLLITSYQRDRMFAEALEAALIRLSEKGLSDVERYHTKRNILWLLAECGKFDTLVKYADEFVKEKDMKVLDRLSAYNTIVDTLNRFKQYPEALRFNRALLASGDFGVDQKAVYELKSASILQSAGDTAEADKIRQNIIADTKQTPERRVDAFIQYYNRVVNDRSSDKKALMSSAKPIFDIPNLPGPLFAKVSVQLLNNANKNLKDGKLVLQMANAIYKYPDVPSSDRLNAMKFIVDDYVLNNDYAKAEKLIREGLAWKNSGINAVTDLYALLGKLRRNQNRCDEAVALYYEILNRFQTGDAVNRVNRLVAAEYEYFRRYDEAAKIWREAKDPLAEALVWRKAGELDKAREMAKKVISDESLSLKTRRGAMEYFLDDSADSREIRAKYAAALTDNFTDSGMMNGFYQAGRWAMYYGNHEQAFELLTSARKAPAIQDKYEAVYYLVRANGALGRYDDAAKLSGEYMTFSKFQPVQRYRMGLENFVFANRSAKDFAKKFTSYEEKLAKELSISNKDRSNTLKLVGRTALTSRLDSVVEELEKVYDSFFVPEPKKEYHVPFYSTRVASLSDFLALKKKPAPQYLDRKYGGNMEFLVTDVSTGGRGAGIGTEDAKKTKPTEMYVLTDSEGLHFFFRYYDDRAREVEAKLIGAGAYEMYLAPGVNQPYTCLMPDLQSGENGIWNTTYNNEYNNRIRENTDDMKYEQMFFDDGILSHLYISWNVYFDKLPENGDIWEFENLHWGRSGGFGWNGTKSIHGRSTWGNLVFDLEKKDMLDAKKKIIFSALARYNAEKRTYQGKEGVIDHWKDPVIGDAAFYASEVAPLVAKLDSYIPLVKADMSASDVEKVFKEAVPYWRTTGFKIDAMRRAYLEKQLTE